MTSVKSEALDIHEGRFLEAVNFARNIFGLHKSITGKGIDEAFQQLKAHTNCDLLEFPTGAEILDWRVPESWVCDSLEVLDCETSEVIVCLDHPLRVASHSNAFSGELTGLELKMHCSVANNLPTSIKHQYVYYDDSWRISLTQDEWNSLEDEKKYAVELKTRHYPGSLKVAEIIIPGAQTQEVTFLSHMCHPAQFNDGLVGVLVNFYLCGWLREFYPKPSYTYKFLFMPETIGSHAYCSDSKRFENMHMAIFTEMLALGTPLHIQMSEHPESYVTRALKAAAEGVIPSARFTEFLGVIRNDEKVFGAPGIDVPSASITRASGRENADHPYRRYHTSEDTIENSDLGALREAIKYIQRFIYVLENDLYVKRNFIGIPMLSRHGLFFNPSEHREKYNLQEKLVWQIKNDKLLSEICLDLECDFVELNELIAAWESKNLISSKPREIEKYIETN
ncbi:MAG: hypothetical protein CMD99_07175 [Gammaproteobacteria bacterium]|nr:hypothetical protein [Gammaproteobacteria bacterium]